MENLESKKTTPTLSIEKYVLLGFLGLIVFHLLGGFFDSNYTWGFSYWSILSKSIIVIFGIISIVSLLLVYFMRFKIRLDFIDQLQISIKTKPLSIFLHIIISIILFYILYNFRSLAHLYGDGYSVLDFCSTHDPLEITYQNNYQMLAVYWHQFMYKTFSSFSSLTPEEIFAFTNVLGGVIGIWGIIKITKLISRSSQERLFFLIISLSSASIILFFGYIENYTWATSFMLWSIYYCIKYINKSCSLLPLLLCSFISVAFHMITFPIIVTILFVLLYRVELIQKLLVNTNRLYIVLLFIIGSIIIMFITRLYQSTIFVPLWQLQGNNYSLFSTNHLVDLINLLMLLTPLGLLFSLYIISSNKGQSSNDNKTEQVLFLISFLTLLSACFIDPLIGMARDWDLLSLCGIPLTLWAGYHFVRMFPEDQFPKWIILASLLIAVIHIVPNLYEKNHPVIAAEYLDKILWEDPHYQINYDNAYRGNSWAYILKKYAMRTDLSERYYSRRIDVDQTDPTPFYNMGVIFINKNQLDSARYYLQKGYKLNPYDPKYLSMFSVIESKNNNHALAETYAKEALKIDSNYIPGLNNLIIILKNQNKIEESLVYLRKVYNLNPNNYTNIFNLGFHYVENLNIDSSYFYYKKALLFAPENKKPELLAQLISITLYMNRKSEAIEYYNQLKIITPDTTLLREIEKEIFKK